MFIYRNNPFASSVILVFFSLNIKVYIQYNIFQTVKQPLLIFLIKAVAEPEKLTSYNN